MSFFKKIRDKIGQKSISTVSSLDTDAYSPGEEITGKVEIVGSEVEEKIESVEVYLSTSVQEKECSQNDVFYSHTVGELTPFVIKKGEEKKVYFSFSLPEVTPFSSDGTMMWFHTTVRTTDGKRSDDKDYILIKKQSIVIKAMEGLEEKGYVLKTIKNEKKEDNVVQVLGYDVSGRFGEEIKKVEWFLSTEDGRFVYHLLFDRFEGTSLEQLERKEECCVKIPVDNDGTEHDSIGDVIDEVIHEEVEKRKKV